MLEQPIKKGRSAQLLKNEIIKRLYFNGENTCATLSLELGKSIPTINAALVDLMAEGIVVEHGFAPSGGGRRPILYALKDNGKYILAIAMDQLLTRMAIVDLKNNFAREVWSFDLPLLGNDGALAQLVVTVNALLDHAGIDRADFMGAGFGMPGFIDERQGLNYTYMSKGGVNLKRYLSGALGMPCYIDNDSSLIALAELRFGTARDKADVMVVNVGWGIGLGMIVNGNIFRGRNGLAGELSHIPLQEDGKLCSCGKHGCLEAEASLLAVVQRVTESVQKEGKAGSMGMGQLPLDNVNQVGEALMEAANNGDQFAVEQLSAAAFEIGKAISILIHIMNPEAIVLSGRGAKVGRILLVPIQQALNKFCIPRLAENIAVEVSPLGHNAALLGAAALVMDNYCQAEG